MRVYVVTGKYRGNEQFIGVYKDKAIAQQNITIRKPGAIKVDENHYRLEVNNNYILWQQKTEVMYTIWEYVI